LPDDARPRHRAVGGPAAYEGHRAVVGHRRGHRGAGTAVGRRVARPRLVGCRLPRHPAARGGRPGPGAGVRAQPRPRDLRPRRRPRRGPLGGARGGPGARHQPRTGARRGRARRRPGGRGAGGRDRLVVRQRRTAFPLYDLDVARRRVFWVAAAAGIIVFGALMGAMFVGQQFLQNVLAYSAVEAGAAILPAAVCMVLVAPRSAKLVDARGSRVTLLVGYGFCVLGFLTMLLLWDESSRYWEVGLGYALVGVGVGFAGTPASHSLTGSVPVRRAGMASGTADLQRDLGGAIMQSILGAGLAAGYASAVGSAIAGSPDRAKITDGVQSQLQKSFGSASDV